jgi:hypothetical protein
MTAETAPAVAAHWHDPTFNLTELEAWSGVPYGTVYQWLQFAWAAGLDVGTKRAGRWLFSCRDLYFLALLLAISDTGVGIAPPQIHAAFDFAEQGKPSGPLILTAPNKASATLVRAPAIWLAVEGLWERCEAAGEKVLA